jgi:hypothetical protein
VAVKVWSLNTYLWHVSAVKVINISIPIRQAGRRFVGYVRAQDSILYIPYEITVPIQLGRYVHPFMHGKVIGFIPDSLRLLQPQACGNFYVHFGDRVTGVARTRQLF